MNSEKHTVLRDSAWRDIPLSGEYRVTLEAVGTHIISSHNSGSISDFDTRRYYELVNRFINDKKLLPPYIELRNYEHLYGKITNEIYQAQKEVFLANQDIIGAYVIYNSPRFHAIKVSLGVRLFNTPMLFSAGTSKDDALKKIDVIMEKLRHRRYPAERVPIHIPSSKTEKRDSPRIPGYERNRTWTDLPLSPGCSVTVFALSPAVLRLEISGPLEENNLPDLFRILEKFSEEYNIHSPAALIISGTPSFSKCLSRQGRSALKEMLNQSRKKIGVIINAAPSLMERIRTISGVSRFAGKLYLSAPGASAARKKGAQYLRSLPQSLQDSRGFSMADIEFRASWFYKSETFSYKSGVINKKLLYSEITGNPVEKDAENVVQTYLQNIFAEDRLTGTSYIRIADYSGLKSFPTPVQKIYADGLRALNRQYLCWPQITFVCGASVRLKAIIRLLSVMLDQRVVFTADVREAFEYVNSGRFESIQSMGYEQNTMVPEKDIQELKRYISFLLWNEKKAMENPLSPISPLYDLGESISVVQSDIMQLRELEQRRKTDLTENLNTLKKLNSLLSQEKHRAEEARREAESANRSKSLFLANTSHEIRTPMNGIIGVAELFEETVLTDTQREYLDIIKKSSQSLLSIINDILDISKIESNSMNLEKIPFSPCSVLNDVAETLSYQIESKKLRFSLQSDPRMPHVVTGDPTRLKQVLINLVGNAAKFTTEGFINMYAGVERFSETGNEATLKFRVKDSGIGIDTDDHNALFDEFTQADLSTTRQFGGTGLGLSICKKLVSMMNGTIGFHSRKGIGTEFWFTLTVSQVSPNHPAEFTDFMQGSSVFIASRDRLLNNSLFSWLNYYGNPHFYVTAQESHLIHVLEEAAQNRSNYDTIIIDESLIRDDVPSRIPPAASAARIILIESLLGPGVSIHPDTETISIKKPFSLTKLMEVLNGTANPQEERSNSQQLPRASTAGPQILIVEDNLINQRIGIKIIENIGAVPVVAANGKEALQILKQQGIALILMDIQMPVMDGYEATREIRRTNKEIPIIAMTANAMDSEKEKCLSAGMNDFVTKPVHIKEISRIIRKWLSPAQR
ncbi:MAG: response regulator [Fibrobacterota bacterium]